MRVLLLLALAGCAAPPDVDRLRGLIDALADEDVEVRTLALAELRRLGPLAEPALRENLRHPEAEVAGRCAELLIELERQNVDVWATLVARVVHVDSTLGFVIISAGRAEGVVGLRFEICRGPKRIASAEFEKYLGAGASMSKLRITAGRAEDVRLDDLAVGF
jgi:hypothetical protein